MCGCKSNTDVSRRAVRPTSFNQPAAFIQPSPISQPAALNLQRSLAPQQPTPQPEGVPVIANVSYFDQERLRIESLRREAIRRSLGGH